VKSDRLALVAVVGALLHQPLTAQPFGPSGGEFRVNTTTAGSHEAPAVGVDLLGRFFIVWSHDDGDAGGVFGRRFNHTGTAIDAIDFRVNVVTTNDQIHPVIAVGQGIDFDTVVTWERDELFARRFDSTGAVTTTFQVNSTGAPTKSSVAMDADGNWVSVWNDAGDVVGQRYNSSGTALGGEFTIATPVGFSPVEVARAPGGAFVVVWEASSGIIQARRYSAAGAPIGSAFQVNTSTGTGVSEPTVAASDDRFVLAWIQQTEASDKDIRTRVYDSAGSPRRPISASTRTPPARSPRPTSAWRTTERSWSCGATAPIATAAGRTRAGASGERASAPPASS
jgi:large repetitive protein